MSDCPCRAGQPKPPGDRVVLDGRAARLAPYMGTWVALRDHEVVAAGASPVVVVQALERADIVADSLFRVPLDPARDVLGG